MQNALSQPVEQVSLLERFLSLSLRMLPFKHGKHRLLNKIDRVLGRHKSGLRAIREGNQTILIDASDLVGRHFLVLGSFDPEVVDVLSGMATEHDEVYWDIGANNGVVCYQMLRKIPSLRVVAIEPQQHLVPLLRHNLERLCPGRFEVFNLGVGEQQAELDLIIPAENRGRASLHHPTSSGTPERISLVTAETIRLRSQFDWPTLVKIDVEGHEPAVIESLLPALQARIPKALVFEHLGGENDAFRRMLHHFTSNGYQVMAIRKTPFATQLVELGQQKGKVTDYAAIRKDMRT